MALALFFSRMAMRVLFLSKEDIFHKIKAALSKFNPLTSFGYSANLSELEFEACNTDYDCIVADVNMITLATINKIKKHKKYLPTLVFSQKEITNKTHLIKGGVEYYIEYMDATKVSELSYAFVTIVRRTRGLYSNVIQIKDLTLDLGAGQLYQDGVLVAIRTRELQMLEYLVLRHGCVVKYKDIETTFNTSRNNILVHIHFLKSTLRLPNRHPALIKPCWGRGLFLKKIPTP